MFPPSMVLKVIFLGSVWTLEMRFEEGTIIFCFTFINNSSHISEHILDCFNSVLLCFKLYLFSLAFMIGRSSSSWWIDEWHLKRFAVTLKLNLCPGFKNLIQFKYWLFFCPALQEVDKIEFFLRGMNLSFGFKGFLLNIYNIMQCLQLWMVVWSPATSLLSYVRL